MRLILGPVVFLLFVGCAPGALEMSIAPEPVGPDSSATLDGPLSDLRGPDTLVADAVAAKAACSDGLDNDDDGLVDFPADPGCNGPTDTDERQPIAAQVLVVYNKNLAASKQIADYYASQRNLSPEQVCGVRLPVGEFATLSQLNQAASEIVTQCICPTLRVPAAACTSNASDPPLAQVLHYNHLVTVLGVPSRLLHGDPLSHLPSFEPQLAAALLTGPLGSPVGAGPGTLADGWPAHAPAPSPQLNGAFALGRLEASTAERTLALIDRTLVAEARGFRGSVGAMLRPGSAQDADDPFYWQFGKRESYPYLARLVGDGDDCAQWLPCKARGEAGCASPQHCRLKVNRASVMPGQGDQLWQPTKLGLYLGIALANGRHAGFGSWDYALNWRKQSSACTPLCRDFASETDRQLCRATSLDIFSEINTDCVGVDLGFVGGQAASYTTRYMGLYPPGWQRVKGTNEGDQPPIRTPPRRATHASAYHDALRIDDQLVHLGRTPIGSSDDSVCTVASTLSPCPEPIWVNLGVDHQLASGLAVASGDAFDLRFRYRAQSSVPLNIRAVVFGSVPGDPETELASKVISTTLASSASWQLFEATLAVASIAANTKITRIVFELRSPPADPTTGFVDLDAFEFQFAGSGTAVLPVVLGSFATTITSHTNIGDWAGNMIDRIGAIGWWGQNGHFGGAPQGALIGRALFAGRTLGEAFAQHTPTAGVLYGDPLYRPVGVHIYADNHAPVSWRRGYTVFADTVDDPRLRITAFMGSAAGTKLSWELARCDQIAPGDLSAACTNGWSPVQTGTGATFGQSIGRISDFVSPAVPTTTLRLRILHADAPDQPLYAYAFLRASPKPKPANCAPDVNQDGRVDLADVSLVRASMSCGASDLAYDVDGDGAVSVTDAEAMLTMQCGFANHPACDANALALGDFDGDGDIDPNDIALIAEHVCNAYVASFDLDANGIVDPNDVQIAQDLALHAGVCL